MQNLLMYILCFCVLSALCLLLGNGIKHFFHPAFHNGNAFSTHAQQKAHPALLMYEIYIFTILIAAALGSLCPGRWVSLECIGFVLKV